MWDATMQVTFPAGEVGQPGVYQVTIDTEKIVAVSNEPTGDRCAIYTTGGAFIVNGEIDDILGAIEAAHG